MEAAEAQVRQHAEEGIAMPLWPPSTKRLAIRATIPQAERKRLDKLLAATRSRQLGRSFDFDGVHYQFARSARCRDPALPRPTTGWRIGRVHIYPSRFEIIIDFNLDASKGQGSGAAVGLNNIENAKNWKARGTRDRKSTSKRTSPVVSYLCPAGSARDSTPGVLDMATAKLSAHVAWTKKLIEKAEFGRTYAGVGRRTRVGAARWWNS